jgi:hypothetical protein
MKRKYAIAQKVWGEFRGELFAGEFSLEAGAHVAADAAEEELLEHLVGLGLAEREPVRRLAANSRKREV